jgi:hypothetical protein
MCEGKIHLFEKSRKFGFTLPESHELQFSGRIICCAGGTGRFLTGVAFPHRDKCAARDGIFVERWGFSSYHRDQDRSRTEAAYGRQRGCARDAEIDGVQVASPARTRSPTLTIRAGVLFSFRSALIFQFHFLIF